MTDDMVRWGMIGCGDVTEEKNGPGLYRASHSTLAGVANRTEARAEDWVKRHGAGKVYDSAEALLADPQIDIVYVATTPNCHKKYAIACAEAGKHCYLEKPIALSYEEAEEIREAFQASGTKIYVAHYRRGMGRYKELRRLLNEGVIGKVRGVQILRTQMLTREERLPEEEKPWRVRSTISGGSYFFEADIHMLDLIDYLVGAAADFKLEISNETGCYQGEDVVSLSMLTETGVMVSGLWCYAAWRELDQILIFGDRGTVTFQYGKNTEPITIETPDGIRQICPPVNPNIGTEQIQDIVDELRGCGVCHSTLESAMRSLKITDAAVKQWTACKNGLKTL
ncbi:Gfo/Idh/MocA family oxidoreductase [Oscillibacter sp.]|uniref:Gfo/Idh/MocA family protein n=1 Tax=Oscillibacter sp. TaxID=1945593 RepID=UPI002632EFD2|nr:Gfo/Idh/MocA family oxidoreductase [Oscillibacter sp.]MDD3347164.1 Gfo/Idh/MocA family oxidoreductase [Oscillibacter sp.]